MLVYCKRRLGRIAEREIKRSDFSAVNVKGFNSQYAPAIKLAKLLIDREGLNIGLNGSNLGYVAPYAVRMESVFEFYVRSQIKSFIKDRRIDDIRLDSFRPYNSNNALMTTENHCYLMQSYVPDIALMKYDARGV